MKTLKQKLLLIPVLLSLPALGALSSGCNLLGWLDSPGTDEARLSAARGCFDAGDFECARTHYEALSSDYEDIRTAELIYLTLEEEGAGFGTFLKTIIGGGTSPGALVNTLANELALLEPGEAKRNRLVSALVQADGISTAGLRGFTRFLVSMTLFAELLAEISGDDTIIDASDLASSPESCASSDCVLDSDCSQPTNGGLSTEGATATLDIIAMETLDGEASIAMVNAVIAQLNASLTEMGASGGYSENSSAIADELGAVSDIPGVNTEELFAQCFVQTMFSLGIVE